MSGDFRIQKHPICEAGTEAAVADEKIYEIRGLLCPEDNLIDYRMEEGADMKYKVKWIEDNLKISRKTLIGYEKDKLIPPNPKGQVREYDQEDIERIWAIKVLQWVGFSKKELREAIESQNADPYSAIALKIEELEDKRQELTRHIKLARKIKRTGIIPSVKTIGSIGFKEFSDAAMEYGEQELIITDDMLKLFEDCEPAEENCDDFPDDEAGANDDRWVMLENLLQQVNENVAMAQISTCFDILVHLKSLGKDNEAIRIVTDQLFQYMQEQSGNNEQDIAAKIVWLFLEKSDASIELERKYGKEGCVYVAEVSARRGGFKSIEDVYQYRCTDSLG